jgi:hypothetical protein
LAGADPLLVLYYSAVRLAAGAELYYSRSVVCIAYPLLVLYYIIVQSECAIADPLL